LASLDEAKKVAEEFLKKQLEIGEMVMSLSMKDIKYDRCDRV
jgi:hypothetical protein